MVIGWLLGGWLANPEWLEPLRRLLRPEAPVAQLDDACRLGALAAFVLACWAWSMPPTPPRSGPARRLAPLAAARLLRRGSLAVYLTCLLGACVTFAFSGQNTPLLLRQLDVPDSWVSATLTLAQLSEVIVLCLLPQLLRRFGVRGTMLLALVAWLMATTVLAVGRPASVVIASLGLHGLFVTGFLIGGQVYLNSVAETDLRASVQAMFSFVSGLGQLIGNLLAGWLRQLADGQPAPSFVVATLITGLMLVLFLVGFRPRTDSPTS
jgi:predicted MFS family arabinose efflux permease